MKVTRRQFVGLAGSASLLGVGSARATSLGSPFTPDAESLVRYKAPDWFRDAKLGMWACWGPEAVPEMGDWYARNMYIQGHPQYEDHLARYGHPSRFGYKDIVPLWKGENWEPDRLMGLYKKAGAKYFCAIAQHHDNFDCWNSRYQNWNSVRMGPKTDVIGRWRDAARSHGLRFGVTEHLAASWNWYGVTKGADKTGSLAGIPYDGANPANQGLYHIGNEMGDQQFWYRNTPDAFQAEWFKRIMDLVDTYQPDLLYSDGSLPFGNYGRQLLAHFYNSNIKQHGGRLEAVYNCKKGDDGGQFYDGMCVEDIERGVSDAVRPAPWQTDTCVGDWYYKKSIQYKSPTTVIQMLLDIVSKNGNLLLNFPLRADGSLDAEEETILAQLTTWIAANGEGIYATRPWIRFGEGHSGPGGKFNEGKVQYTSDDLRFTVKDRTLFCFAMAWPDAGSLAIRSLAGRQVQSVTMLDGGDALQFKRGPDALIVSMPPQRRGDHAFGVRILGAVD